MLIIVQNKLYFQYNKTFSWLHVIFFDIEHWAIYFTLFAPMWSKVS